MGAGILTKRKSIAPTRVTCAEEFNAFHARHLLRLIIVWSYGICLKGYLRLETHMGIRLAVQLPQNAFIERVASSNIVVECDMQTCCPQSEHEVTA